MDKKTTPQTLPVYKRYQDYSIDIYSQQENATNRLLRGRGLMNPEKGEFAFVENAPRGKRSVEIGRTLHCRFVRRPDGEYTATFRFNATEKLIKEQLVAEVRDVVKGCGMDVNKQRDKQKKEEEAKND